MSAKSDGSTANASSRLTVANSRMSPLCIQSQPPCRNGWQLVCWIAPPVEARMCANTSCDSRWRARSLRLRSFQAGSTLWNTPGVSPTPYQPRPNPSPFVVVAPSCEWRLWSISEWAGRSSRSSSRTGDPEYASQRHMISPFSIDPEAQDD